ncbi:tyrosine-type recombinase/integrase [Zhongshania guokunii]|uniref:Tyrosine-type recombinase/integrase n=1 Tax=Zhongshania guokunii TaxID=641783 RepID=A0ABV3UBX4_9GAMM
MALLEFTDVLYEDISIKNVPVLFDDEYQIIEAPTEWLISKSQIRSRSRDTRTNYAYVIAHFFNWLQEKGKLWNLITKSDINRFVTEQLHSLKPDGSSLEGVTINYRIDRIMDFYKFASMKGYRHFVDTDGVNKVHQGDPDDQLLSHINGGRSTYVDHGLKVPQVEKKVQIIARRDFIRGCKALNDVAYVVAAVVMYLVGLRRMEVVQLEYRTRQNTDFLPLREYERLIDEGSCRDLTFSFKGKGGKSRRILFPFELWEWIDDIYLPVRQERAKLYAEKYGQNPTQLLLTKAGNPLTRTGISDRFRTVALAHGIIFRPHVFRHCFATGFVIQFLDAHKLSPTVLYDPGLDLALREYLGHSDIKTTKKYIHLVHMLRGRDLLRDYRPKLGEDLRSVIDGVERS